MNADTESLLRASFPYLRERAYLDTAAAGLTWAGHGDAVARFYEEVKGRGIDARPEWQEATQRVRDRLGLLLGVPSADLVFVSNTTEGLNLVVHSLRLEPGSRVVHAADEFPSMVRAWEAARERGVEVVAVPILHEGARESSLLAALDATTRVLAVSQTHWCTGTTVDLARLGAACRSRGVLLMVDGMQAMGAVPTDLSQVDVYTASFFKWMLSGFGIGLLATSAAARAAMVPAYRGYANSEDSTRLQYAHVNVPALYGLDATLDYFDRVGWIRVHGRVRELGAHLVAGAARRGLALATPPTARAGIFALPWLDPEAARAALAARGISVSARDRFVRISPHFYNTTDEIDRCLDALAEIAAES